MKTIEIQVEVTQEHIDKGTSADCYACPIALAMTELGLENVMVDTGTFCYGRFYLGYSTPGIEAQSFISKFDDGEPVQPFTFPLTVEVPDDFQPVSKINPSGNKPEPNLATM